jgi:hypothetical protein
MYGLGLKVTEHVLRRNYGIMRSTPFIEGKHPEELKYQNPEGVLKCRRHMEWLAKRVNIFFWQLS